MKLTKGVDQSWVSMVDGLALEVRMIDRSKKKPRAIHMICTDLQETPFVINTLDYNNPF